MLAATKSSTFIGKDRTVSFWKLRVPSTPDNELSIMQVVDIIESVSSSLTGFLALHDGLQPNGAEVSVSNYYQQVNRQASMHVPEK
jgi:hypothetical protein